MGKLFDEFGNMTFQNEAEVSQNFILPLLQTYLGYELREIVPEHNYSVRDIYSGVNRVKGGSKLLLHRPDFVVCLNGDVDDPKFVIDSKGPDEDIDAHLDQLRSYAISVGKNILMITNGKVLKVFDVNNLLFHSENVAGLQLKIDKLFELLGRDNQALKPLIDIIKDFDYKGAISLSEQAVFDQEVQRKGIVLSDFQVYLRKICAEFENWHLPTNHFQALDNLQLSKIDPNYLLSFQIHDSDSNRLGKPTYLKLPEIETDRQLNIKIFIGETGTGKSCLLKFLTYRAAQSCLELRETRIPVFVTLRQIGLGNKLEDIIVDYLNRRGYRCNSFYDLPNANDFVFFLDAYDEISEQFLSESIVAIENLGVKFECYLTSRPSRIPTFRPSMILDVLPISASQSSAIIRKYIDSQYYEFQRQLESNNLKQEAANILLLLFLISLFKEYGSFPNTVTQIIGAIIERVKKWQEGKRRVKMQLNWKAIEQLLAVLADKLIESGQISLGKPEAMEILRIKLDDLETRREVSGGMSIDQSIDLLAETGLVIVNDDHIYFWHRLFLNYFASVGLVMKYQSDLSAIGELLKDERWHIPIVGLAGLLPSVTVLVRELKENMFLAAFCLMENNQCEEQEALNVTEALIDQCKSVIPNVRKRAVNYLVNIENDHITKFFLSVVESDYPSDVRMSAFRVIGKAKSAEVKEMIYQNLGWNESSIWTGTSAQACIARALFYYGEQEHVQIVKNWAEASDWIVDEECLNIFVELNSRHQLTPLIISALQAAFISYFEGNRTYRDKIVTMAKVLALKPDDQFAIRLIEMPVNDKELWIMDGFCELLKEYRSLDIVILVMNKIFERSERDYVAEEMVQIITESACDVPKEIYYELATHPNSNIASKAIGALSRFPYNDVKYEVEKYLYGEEPQLQSWALGVLVDNSEVVELIRQKRFPEHFYSPCAHTLLRAVRRFHLVEAMPLMEKVFKSMGEHKLYYQDVHLALELAGTYFFMAENDKHTKIISWFFNGENFVQRDDNIHFHLMKSVKYFEPSLALKISQCYFRTYFPFLDESRFKMQVFLESVEDLGQRKLKSNVKEIVEHLLTFLLTDKSEVDFHLERPMRTLVGIVDPEDEDWLLGHLDAMTFDKGFEFPQLRRAAECLAYAGSIRSIPYLRKIAIQCKNSDAVLNVCQYAYEQICRREGTQYQKGDLLQ